MNELLGLSWVGLKSGAGRGAGLNLIGSRSPSKSSMNFNLATSKLCVVQPDF